MTEHETEGSTIAYILWWSQNIFPGVKLNLKKLFSSHLGFKLNIKKLFSRYLHPMAEPKIFLGPS